jgi:hypothetical protein
MSRRTSGDDAKVQKLQKGIADLKESLQSTPIEACCEEVSLASENACANSQEFEKLTPTEQAAASLGVHPEAWKPISFMNAAHYESLKKQNAIDETLTRRIEAFRSISA